MKAPKTPPKPLKFWALETTNDIQYSPMGTVQYVLKEVKQHFPKEKRLLHTVDGRHHPAPVDMVNIPLFTWFDTSQVVQDSFHQWYHLQSQCSRLYVVRTGQMKSVWAAQLRSRSQTPSRMVGRRSFPYWNDSFFRWDMACFEGVWSVFGWTFVQVSLATLVVRVMY